MKTHDAASTLESVAKILREGENVELSANALNTKRGKAPAASLGANAPAALALLVRLAGYSKAEWRALIANLDLNVEIKATDSIRDILGRLLRYLNDHKDVQERLVEQAKKPRADVSPELVKALSILMNK